MISIIISAYNSERTIEKAIKSCLNQTYKDLEIIVVEDCSTDKTKEVIKSIKDDRIKLIENEKNLGAGMCRRIGSKAATGEYTNFLDSDDWLAPDFIETMYNEAKKENAVIVSCGIIIADDNINKDWEIVNYREREVYTNPNTVSLLSGWIGRFLNNKLIKRDLWDKVEYSGRRFCEDTQTSFYLQSEPGKKLNLTYNGYYYYQREGSLCHTSSKIKKAIYRALCAKDICEYIAKKYGPGEVYLNSVKAFLIRISEISSLEDLLDSENIREIYKDELAEIFEYFLKHVKL